MIVQCTCGERWQDPRCQAHSVEYRHEGVTPRLTLTPQMLVSYMRIAMRMLADNKAPRA